ncbi:lysine--tRNA ligase [Candidatus Phytoplasma melaleucae]|uniref:Lysine--tRNA ligase n=1 Tax=Candidatus Phytoplasma melaleucae TaxID=2982630 RepID=A0ABT9DDP4_9MOLU|nr:lysine--tRNA ligase ['Melaleuca sp.' phytoplasma]MDO8168150.1 lysine--tRNA ligase ['Melaleuca sp.' phytoplasma]MDV3205222.1 lysine--tRNA ligase [Weeping tea tree witches'-broom phytoplasma]
MGSEQFTEQFIIRKEKLKYLQELNVDPFRNKFTVKNKISDLLKKHKLVESSKLENSQIIVEVAGRIVLKRIQGKAGFLQLQDFDDQIQVYLNQNLVSEKAFLIYKNADLGDIVGIIGYLFKTKTDELTIKATEFIHLSKSLIPLPDKHKGLKDKEIIRKKRYLDLIINSKTRKTFLYRSKIIKAIRNFFDNKNFLEVETPILNSVFGGASAKPFVTHHNALDSDFYLRIATEIPLKKLIVGGLGAVYELGRVFRNEGIDANHNPEFTTIEAYLAYSDMEGMMSLTESCLKEVCQQILGTLVFTYQGQKINFNQFYRFDMIEIIKAKTGIDFYQNMSLSDCKELAHKNDIPLKPFYNRGHIISAFFEKFVEPTLIQPTFIYNYPLEISPLAQINLRDERFTDRFELFVAGKELVNAFSELNDPLEQKKRFENQLIQKTLGDCEIDELDHDFIETLEYGMPPTGGLGIGIDRLVMLLTDNSNIRDVILFPHFKHKKSMP